MANSFAERGSVVFLPDGTATEPRLGDHPVDVLSTILLPWP